MISSCYYIFSPRMEIIDQSSIPTVCSFAVMMFYSAVFMSTNWILSVMSNLLVTVAIFYYFYWH